MQLNVPNQYFNFFQLGLVTRELDAGIETLQKQYGIGEVSILRDMAVTTSKGEAYVDAAFAFVGSLQFEMMAPTGGAVDAYRDFLPEEVGAIRPHHFGHLLPDRESWEKVSAAVAESGLPTPVKGSVGDEIFYVYVDTVSSLGLLTEFMLVPRSVSFFFDAPRYPAG